MKSNSRLIFIVDDDPDDRQIILDAFLERSPQIDYVFIENAETLLHNLYAEEAEYPALILLDLRTPQMNSFDFLIQVRADPATRDLPIINFGATVAANWNNFDLSVLLQGATDYHIQFDEQLASPLQYGRSALVEFLNSVAAKGYPDSPLAGHEPHLPHRRREIAERIA